jgi:hypothetical protein
MILETLLALGATLTPAHACPISAATALPELTGTWHVQMISGLDGPRPDSTSARATIAPDLQACLLREQLRAQTENYEAFILWGVNGADSSVQRIFTHSRHGRIGLYEGRRTGDTIALRQQLAASQPASLVVEHQVLIRDGDHFSIASRLSNDGGRSWQALSRLEYDRAAP